MPLQIKHGSWLKTKSGGGDKYGYTLYGSKEDIDAEYEERQVGANDPYNDGATIENSTVRMGDGAAWYELEVTSMMRTGADGMITSGLGAGPTETSLSIRTMELPLEACKTSYFGNKYRTKWNWILIGKGPINPTTKEITPPLENDWLSTWENATDVKALTNKDIYRWVKDPNDIPGKESGFGWLILKDKTKPGIESFYFPTAEITERGYHKNALDATWVVAHAAKRKAPKLGTFNIPTGEWLCMGGTVEKSGNIWIATCSYQWSPEKWDHDLYNQ